MADFTGARMIMCQKYSATRRPPVPFSPQISQHRCFFLAICYKRNRIHHSLAPSSQIPSHLHTQFINPTAHRPRSPRIPPPNMSQQQVSANLVDSPVPQQAPVLATTKTKKKSKKLCHYKECREPHSIIGDCNFCQGKFCTRHRLLESHNCAHYREVQKDYHERNAKQLQSQQTVVSKV